MEEKIANFIHDIIEKDLADGTVEKIHTRFPPEPNGYLHIGSAKAIRINSGAAKKYGGLFNLRYDDTNPEREDEEYVKSIYEDIKWLTGEEPSGGVFFGSDYFEKCCEFAVKLIKDGKAYVCDLSPEEMSEYRGDFNRAGKPSPFRERSVEENLDLFNRMKNGEFPNGARTLRAKIDMASPNMNMRDPAIYRINHAEHHRQGDKWKIYPLYDYAHPIQDALEGVTHSCCSIEFENHRPLYDWVVENIGFDPPPRQYEFARLNVTYTVMSKRYLRELVETKSVDGWDDPRMPTLCGLRRRGYTPSAICKFLDNAGYSKADSVVDIAMLEHCMREELNLSAPRKIAVIEPLLITITNYPDNKTETFDLPNNPQNPEAGTRPLTFTKRLYVERSDFSDNPPPKFHRLKLGCEARLMGAYIVKCEEVIYGEDGHVKELLCSADLETGNGVPADGRKVKGTIHWLSADNCIDGVIMQYDRLFTEENVLDKLSQDGVNFEDLINPNSAKRYENAKLETSLKDASLEGENRFQFVRNGYFCLDVKEANTWNSIVGLKSGFKA